MNDTVIFFILVALLAAYLIGKNAMDPIETGYDEDYREISFDDVGGAPAVVRRVRSEK